MTDRVVYLNFGRTITKSEKERLFQLHLVDRLVDDEEAESIVLLSRPTRKEDLQPTLDLIRMIMDGDYPALGIVETWSGLDIDPIETKLMVREWMPVRRPMESLDDFIRRMRIFSRIERLVWDGEGNAS
jgi:hypothetical protein